MKIIVDLTIGNSILFLAGGEIKAQAQINQHPYRKYNPLKSMHTRTEIEKDKHQRLLISVHIS